MEVANKYATDCLQILILNVNLFKGYFVARKTSMVNYIHPHYPDSLTKYNLWNLDRNGGNKNSFDSKSYKFYYTISKVYCPRKRNFVY